jgi:NADH:ubiquinone oxidoreductase subunit F (NADH-binding)
MEPGPAHVARLGPAPRGGAGLIEVLERSDLRGRGGASFPVGTKWRTVAGRRGGSAVLLANGAEGEPLSYKDRLLMQCRPHLVIDGAFLAATSVGADDIVLFVGEDHRPARAALERALAERADHPCRVRFVSAPARYVAGEESAAVHSVNDGVALPTSIPPRPFEKGVGGRPTLVQNVETLAHVALIARYGDRWYHEGGRDGAGGTALLSISGAVRQASVLEVAQGSTIGEAVEAVGGATAPVGAVLLGGYFGGWVLADEAWSLPLDSMRLRARGKALGCGTVALLPANRCGVAMTALIASYLADQSARQCGPCVFGLRAIADALTRVATCTPDPHDLTRLRTWSSELRGRGACRHPDGAAGLVLSALDAFDTEFFSHATQRRCSSPGPPMEAAQWTS